MLFDYPFLLDEAALVDRAKQLADQYKHGEPFPHIVIDNFLSQAHAEFLAHYFPDVSHLVWSDWRNKGMPNQYGKQGTRNSESFSLLDPILVLALQEFNSYKFLLFLERLTGIEKLIPDPYFQGGGLHQIEKGGILDIHTDFNDYPRLNLYRRLNVLIYLTEEWQPAYGGCLELWDGGAGRGTCVRSIAPIFNRAVIFHTDKKSFHGHPEAWDAPEPITRKSMALYYYTSYKLKGHTYDRKTDFQGVSVKPLPT